MGLNFLSKRGHNNEIPEEWVDIFEEEYQVAPEKPDLGFLEKGFIQCENCGEGLALEVLTPLTVQNCYNCGYPAFVPLRIKDYWLYAPLGGGGMGAVYHVFYTKDPDIELAVKVLPRKQKRNQELIEALMREARIGHSFGKHPHLSQVMDFGYSNDEYFAAFEYLRGVRLDRIIEAGTVRPQKQLLLWMLQLLKAEQHIYDKGYLFRDLKPQNIIIDMDGNVKLIDYGLAITIEDAMNNISDNIEGSLHYIPPERILGTGETQASELYSLGMVIYHLLAQHTYFNESEVQKLAARHVVAIRMKNIRFKLPTGIHPHLILALEKMMSRNPAARYQTYKEAAQALMKVYKRL